MPNWCSNTTYVTGSAETLQWLESIHFNFDDMRPRPADQDANWYDWNVANWGTKWPAHDVEIDNMQPGTLIVRYRTAWSPPTHLLQYITEHHNVILRNIFIGECYEFAGQDVFEGDTKISEYVEPAEMSDVDLLNFGASHNWFPYAEFMEFHSAMMGGAPPQGPEQPQDPLPQG